MPDRRNYLTIVCFIIVSGFSCLHAAAQHYNVIKIDGIGAISSLRVFRPSFERTITKNISALLYYENGTYSTGSVQGAATVTGEVYKLTGWGFMPEVRFYPFFKRKTAPAGLFVGVFVKYRKLTELYTGEDKTASNSSNPPHVNIQTTGNAYADGLDIGYKWIMDKIVVEVLGGFGSSWGNWETPNDRNKIYELYKSDLGSAENSLRLEISLGFVFPKYKTEKINSQSSEE